MSDYINRQDAIDAINAYQFEDGRLDCYAEEIVAEIEDIPAVVVVKQIRGEWIPVTERLPDFDEVVQITDGFNVGHGYLVGVCSSTGYVACMWDSPFCDIDEKHITHWMPLPEPPESESET